MEKPYYTTKLGEINFKKATFRQDLSDFIIKELCYDPATADLACVTEICILALVNPSYELNQLYKITAALFECSESTISYRVRRSLIDSSDRRIKLYGYDAFPSMKSVVQFAQLHLFTHKEIASLIWLEHLKAHGKKKELLQIMFEEGLLDKQDFAVSERGSSIIDEMLADIPAEEMEPKEE